MLFTKSVFLFHCLLIITIITPHISGLNVPLSIDGDQLLQQSAAYITQNQGILVSDEPECNNENHRAKIVILPVIVPHNMGLHGGGGGTQIKILPMNQIPIIIKAKRGDEGATLTTIVDTQSSNTHHSDHHHHHLHQPSHISRESKYPQFQTIRIRNSNKHVNNNNHNNNNNHHHLHHRQTLWPYQRNSDKITINDDKPEGIIIDADYSSNHNLPNIKMQKMKDQDLPLLSQILVNNLNQKDIDWDYFNK